MRFTITPRNGDAISLRTVRPANGIGVYITGLEGWFGTPGPREDTIERAGADGDFAPITLTQGPRIITMYGYARFDSSMGCGSFRDKINGLSCGMITVEGEDASGLRICEGYLSDDPAPKVYEAEKVVTFSLVITCPDPHKYGIAKTFHTKGNVCNVVNEGNAPSLPSVYVAGPVTTLTMSLNGSTVKWSGSASSLDFDFRNMEPSSGTVTVDNAFEIPPGESRLFVQSDGAVDVTVRPAWR